MGAVPVSDTARYGDRPRYAYREVSKKYDLKIKNLISDTPSDTFGPITAHLKEHQEPINIGPSKLN